jgi:hypothetical protein
MGGYSASQAGRQTVHVLSAAVEVGDGTNCYLTLTSDVQHRIAVAN